MLIQGMLIGFNSSGYEECYFLYSNFIYINNLLYLFEK